MLAVCGIGVVLYVVTNATKRSHIIVDTGKENSGKNLGPLKHAVIIEGDATDDNTLLKAGIERAKGLFATTGDDNQNLVISLTAKQLNPRLRVIARCNDIKNGEKIKKAGADSVISPSFIGGLRMASEMIRPTVVSFLDTMLRDKEKNLRVEEVLVPGRFTGKAIPALNLKRYPHMLLLAIKTEEDWIYNPPESYVIKPANTLVLMTTPEERDKLEKALRLFPA